MEIVEMADKQGHNQPADRRCSCYSGSYVRIYQKLSQVIRAPVKLLGTRERLQPFEGGCDALRKVA